MTSSVFRSALVNRLQAFLDLRRALGRGASDRKLLIYIDRFLAGHLRRGEPITRETTECWVRSMASLTVGTRINRISMWRQFCSYLSHFDPRTYIIHRAALPRRIRPAPYIYTLQEVQAIMTAAKQIGPPGSLRPHVFTTIIGLLYASGLRIGEALKLTLEDIELRQRLLTIRDTKFHKSRYVPLSEGTTCALASFLRKRRAFGYSAQPTAPVFVNPAGKAYGAPRICAVFLEILRRIGLRGPVGQRGPRLHDFRHSFAVGRLAAWYRQGAELPAKMPLLTTYLGHTTVTCTEVYLRATAELLEQANKRFYKHCAIPRLNEVNHVH